MCDHARMPASFLFYDLETFGSNPRQSRIAQFAAIRTDLHLNEIEPPMPFFLSSPKIVFARIWATPAADTLSSLVE